MQASPGRAKIFVARLSGSFRFSQGMERVGRGSSRNKWSGTRASVGRGRAKRSGVGVVRWLSALWSTRCLEQDGRELTVGERAAEASFGIGESSETEFGWGHRQRAALVRHCVLTGFSRLSTAANGADLPTVYRKRKRYLERACPLRLLLSIVRSLAHLPEVRQCPIRDFDAALTKHAWHE